MKKFLLKLIGDSFIKDLILKVGNRLLDKFFFWLIKTLQNKFGNRPFWFDLQTFLLRVDIQDFFKEPAAQKEVETLCKECHD